MSCNSNLTDLAINSVYEENLNIGYGPVTDDCGDEWSKIGIHTVTTQSVFNAKDLGLIGDGIVNDTAALTAALVTAAGKTIFFPTGTYYLDAFNFPADIKIWMARGAMFKRRSGNISFAGPLEAPIAQIFSGYVSQQVRFGGPNLNDGYKSVIPTTYPDWWGVNGNVAPYDTNAVQCAFDAPIPTTFVRQYYVTQVNLLFQNNGLVVKANSFPLYGVATVATDCILRISGLNLKVTNLYLTSGYNTNYACACHMYADIDNPLVGFNYIQGLKITNTQIGLVIGALPAAAPTYNAPVIGGIYDYETAGVEQVCHCDQPNGKMNFYNSQFLVSIAGTPWTMANTYCLRTIPPDGTADRGGMELAIVGGTIQNSGVGSTTGTGIDIGGNVSIRDAIWEVVGKSYVRKVTGAYPSSLPNSGTCLILSGLKDAGGPSVNTQDYFVVDADCHGQLILEGSNWVLPAGTGTSAHGGLLVNARTAHPKFQTIIKDCTIYEWPWTSNNTNNVDNPLVSGGITILKNVRYVRYDNPVTTQTIDELYNTTLRSLFTTANPTGSSMSAVADQAAKDGWTWGGSGGAGTNFFNSQAAILPSNTNLLATIQLISDAGNGAIITSPTGTNGFKIDADRPLVFSAWVKTNLTAGLVYVLVNFYKYSGAASAVTLFEGPSAGVWRAMYFDPSLMITYQNWTKLMCRVPVPADAVTASITLGATNGSTMLITDISIGN